MWFELKRIISKWVRRHRFNRAVHWGMRGLAVGLATGIFVTLALIPRHQIDALEFIEWVYLCAQIGLLIGFVVAFAWPLNQIRLIHWFDQVFEMQERVSTAVEIQRIVTRNLAGKEILLRGWRDRQLFETVEAAKKVKPGKMNPFRWERSILLLVYGMGFLTIVLWIYAQPQFDITDLQRQERLYLNTEIERVQAQINDIKQANNLSESQKNALAQPLNDALNRLQSAGSPEQVLAALEQAQQQYQSMDTPPGSKLTQSLSSMGQQLGKTDQSPFGGVGGELSSGNLVSAGRAMQMLDFAKMSPEQRQAAMKELNQAGQNLVFSNPQISKEMLAAAIALQQGNYPSAQQFMRDAGRTIEQTGNQAVEAQVAKNAATQLQQQQEMVNQQSLPSNAAAQKTAVALQKTPAAVGSVSTNNHNVTNDAGYDSIYAPGQTGNGQPAGNNGQPNTPAGASQVPYINVLPSYSQSNQKAIENGDVPAYLQPVIRNYFSSLAPQ